MKVAVAVSSAWPQYYASSPFLNLLNGWHPNFKIFGRLPHECADAAFQEEVQGYDALVVDDVLAQSVKFYTNGPKLMVGGDPHAHRPDQVERLKAEYACVDYVLTGAVFMKRIERRPYLYPPIELWDKHVYWPHMVGGQRPDALPPWEQRKTVALLSGSVSEDVYPFRGACRRLIAHGYPIEQMPFQKFTHSAYFAEVAKYRMAITCPSIFQGAMAKYFEIPWLGTILLAPSLCEEENVILGFVEGKNVVWVDNPQYVDRLISIVNNEPAWSAQIAKEGADLMLKSHTIYRRLDYILKLVEKIKAGGFNPKDAPGIFLKHRLETP